MKSKKISVDWEQQCKEKNQYWGDYPCKISCGRRLPKSLSAYFKSWDDYVKNGNDELYAN